MLVTFHHTKNDPSLMSTSGAISITICLIYMFHLPKGNANHSSSFFVMEMSQMTRLLFYFARQAVILFCLYSVFYEADDDQMCHFIDAKFTQKEISFGGTTLLPNDLEDTKTFLIRSHNRNWKALDFNSCHIFSRSWIPITAP